MNQDDNTPLEHPIVPPIPKRKGLPKGVSGNIYGRGIYKKKVEAFEDLPNKEQNAYLRDIWKSVALGIAERARTFSTGCSPKDFGKLYQLVQSGSTAIDKAFPPKQDIQSPKLIFNLFNSLGQRATRIAVPETPVIDVKGITTSPSVPECPSESGEEPRSTSVADIGGDRSSEDPGEL